jgi:hypothetical protein
MKDMKTTKPHFTKTSPTPQGDLKALKALGCISIKFSIFFLPACARGLSYWWWDERVIQLLVEIIEIRVKAFKAFKALSPWPVERRGAARC